ncbi:MAG: hypothetical protein AAFO98_12885 [Pseudomonadota bacterium]
MAQDEQLPAAGPVPVPPMPRPDEKANLDDDVDLLRRLAHLHALYGRFEQSLRLLQVSDFLRQDDPETLRRMAECYLRMGQPETTFEILLKIKELGSDLMTVRDYRLIGEACARANNHERARKIFALLRDHSDDPDLPLPETLSEHTTDLMQ